MCNKFDTVCLCVCVSCSHGQTDRHTDLILSWRFSGSKFNEDLTQRRSQLFYEGRNLRKQGRIFGVWTQQGNILIKVTQKSQPKEVTNYKQIIAQIENQSDSIPLDTDTDPEMSSSQGSDGPDYDDV